MTASAAVADLELREPVEADYETIAGLRNRSYPWDVPIDRTTVAWSLRRADPGRPNAVLLGHRDGELVGVGYVRGVPGHPGLLAEVYIDPDLRRRGSGSALYAATLERIGPTNPSTAPHRAAAGGRPTGSAGTLDRCARRTRNPSDLQAIHQDTTSATRVEVERLIEEGSPDRQRRLSGSGSRRRRSGR